MSSFDKTAGKNLDEILASIRKTLADESTPPDAAQPGVPANSSASPLANGSPAASAKIDDDFADLLAGGLGTAPVPSPGREAADGAPADQKDPLWFLRPSGGRETQVLPLPPDRPLPSLDGLVDGGVPPPQRSSFTTQFISDSHGGGVQPAAAGPSSPELPAEAAASPALAAEPRTIFKSKPENGLSLEALGPGSAKASDAADVGPPAAASASDPAAASKPPAVGPGGKEAGTKSSASAGKADTANFGGTPGEGSASAGSPSPVVKPVAGAAKPDAGQQPVAATGNPAAPADAGKPAAAPATAAPSRFGAGMAGPSVSKTAPTPARASGLNGAAAAGTAAAPTPAGAKAVPPSQTQAIEQIIEQLLEPLLRRWVEANLPRLMEVTIRAEVERALEKKSASGPEAERKL